MNNCSRAAAGSNAALTAPSVAPASVRGAKPRILAVSAIAALLAASAMSGAWADQVTLVEGHTFKASSVVGGRVNGDITKETASAVTVNANGTAVTIPIDQIERVVYADEPAVMVAARSRTDLTKAVDEFQKAAAEAKGKPLVEQAALFGQYRAVANLALGDPSRVDASIAQLQKFVKTYSDSRHKAEALELLVRLQSQKNDLAGAKQSAADLGKIAWSADHAKVLDARLATKTADSGQLDSALTSLNGLIQASKNAAVKRDAMVAKAEVLAAQKKFPEAEAAAKQVSAEADPDDGKTQAIAFNTLGDCLLAADKPKDAILAYLRTDLLYRNADKEQHARALAQIAKIWRMLKQDARATEVIGQLKAQYPSSPWLNAAQGNP